MRIVDAHLDLSANALNGRDVLRPAIEQDQTGRTIPTVGLPDLRKGGVDLICATVFCAPAWEGRVREGGYTTADEANAEGLRHLDWYRRQTEAGHFRFVRTRSDVDAPDTGAQAAILLLEGADPLRDERDVAHWHAAGMRIVGLAWRATRHAGGTGCPGPLTAAGVEMVRLLDQFGIIHDASHLAEESFWQLLERTAGPVMASHSNCRSIVPTDRQLSDEMARAIFARGGVVGINFFDKFLLPPADYGHRRATLADLVTHVKHLCDLAGDTAHVGIGTDMDGGLGRDEIPVEITTSADLPRVADALSAAGFDDAGVAGVMGENWVQYFRMHLPA
jgi:membrane dipeptidase